MAFTVIEGGGKGPPNRHDIQSEHHIRKLVIEVLRAVARGDDHGCRVATHLEELMQHLPLAPTPPGMITNAVFREVNEQLIPDRGTEYGTDRRFACCGGNARA